MATTKDLVQSEINLIGSLESLGEEYFGEYRERSYGALTGSFAH
jgi:hypothetical protein